MADDGGQLAGLVLLLQTGYGKAVFLIVKGDALQGALDCFQLFLGHVGW